MALGGHDTFAVREGWLHRGLKLLTESPDLLVCEHAADWLGVGRNMAKSIRHWLTATALAEPSERTGGKRVPLQITDLGTLVFELDPYLLLPGTWWALHVNVVRTRQAETWGWFFNKFFSPRFDRATCIEKFRHYLQTTRKRMPSDKTIERDIGCLLHTYSRQIPPPREDPEDARESPFVGLGLLLHHRKSGSYETVRAGKEIPPQLLGYCLAKGLLSFDGEEQPEGPQDVSLQDALYMDYSPGRVFCLDPESLHELAKSAEASMPGEVRIFGLAGEQSLRVQSLPPVTWLQRYYESQTARRGHVA